MYQFGLIYLVNLISREIVKTYLENINNFYTLSCNVQVKCYLENLVMSKNSFLSFVLNLVLDFFCKTLC